MKNIDFNHPLRVGAKSSFYAQGKKVAACPRPCLPLQTGDPLSVSGLAGRPAGGLLALYQELHFSRTQAAKSSEVIDFRGFLSIAQPYTAAVYNFYSRERSFTNCIKLEIYCVIPISN